MRLSITIALSFIARSTYGLETRCVVLSHASSKMIAMLDKAGRPSQRQMCSILSRLSASRARWIRRVSVDGGYGESLTVSSRGESFWNAEVWGRDRMGAEAGG